MQEAPVSPAQPTVYPAQACLASTLYDLARLKTTNTRPIRVPTACAVIDDALQGGFDYGRVSLISGEPSTGKTTLALHALTSHILDEDGDTTPGASTAREAAIIDTSGTFDVLRLHGIVLARLRARHDAVAKRQRANQVLDRDWNDSDFGAKVGNVEEEAAKVLDRVKILSVFDFVGVVDGVGEIRAELERTSKVKENGGASGTGLDVQQKDLGEKRERGTLAGSKQALKRTEILDSDDEGSDAEMLYPGEGEPTTEDKSDTLQAGKEGHEPQPEAQGHTTMPSTGSVGLLIIDNIATTLTPLMKNNYVHAHALLTPFMRHLTHLTQQHNLCTIIINSTTPLRGYRDYAPQTATTSFPSLTPFDSGTEHGKPSTAVEDNPSIFACNGVKPALGATFGAFADVHLLLTKVPLSRKDAAVALGSQRDGTEARKVATAVVVEVMTDRYSGRVGRWAAINVQDDGSMSSAV